MTFSLVVICTAWQVLLTTPFCNRGVMQNFTSARICVFERKTNSLLISGNTGSHAAQKTSHLHDRASNLHIWRGFLCFYMGAGKIKHLFLHFQNKIEINNWFTALRDVSLFVAVSFINRFFFLLAG